MVQAKCVDVAVTLLYILLVSAFLGWGFVHKKRRRSSDSRTKPLVNVTNGGVVRQVNRQKDDNIPMQVHAIS